VECDDKELDKLLSAHYEVTTHLGKRASDDQAYEVFRFTSLYYPATNTIQSALELTSATLGLELAQGLKQIGAWIENPEDDSGDAAPNNTKKKVIKDPHSLLQFGKKIKLAMREVWKDRVTDVFDFGWDLSFIQKFRAHILYVFQLARGSGPS
jgi:cohesin loading factor subunit SCC2